MTQATYKTDRDDAAKRLDAIEITADVWVYQPHGSDDHLTVTSDDLETLGRDLRLDAAEGGVRVNSWIQQWEKMRCVKATPETSAGRQMLRALVSRKRSTDDEIQQWEKRIDEVHEGYPGNLTYNG